MLTVQEKVYKLFVKHGTVEVFRALRETLINRLDGYEWEDMDTLLSSLINKEEEKEKQTKEHSYTFCQDYQDYPDPTDTVRNSQNQ